MFAERELVIIGIQIPIQSSSKISAKMIELAARPIKFVAGRISTHGTVFARPRFVHLLDDSVGKVYTSRESSAARVKLLRALSEDGIRSMGSAGEHPTVMRFQSRVGPDLKTVVLTGDQGEGESAWTKLLSGAEPR